LAIEQNRFLAYAKDVLAAYGDDRGF
jgi:hypothetical protein